MDLADKRIPDLEDMTIEMFKLKSEEKRYKNEQSGLHKNCVTATEAITPHVETREGKRKRNQRNIQSWTEDFP